MPTCQVNSPLLRQFVINENLWDSRSKHFHAKRAPRPSGRSGILVFSLITLARTLGGFVVAFLAVLFFAFIGLIVILVVRSTLIGRRLRHLEDRMSVLERSVRGLSVQQPTSEPSGDHLHLSLSPEPPAPSTLTPITSTRSPIPDTRSPIPDTASTPTRTRAEWEAFVGGRLLNRIGALAIIIGIGFFLKHAFDNNWISEPVRVLIGAAAGVACLAFARRTHQQGFAVFSQGLVGSGIGILYLSVYATFNFYALLPQIPSFVLMLAVTVLALAQAIQYRSFAVALLGWAGGYLTPWMLSTGDANEVKLFGYLALLTVGLLGLAVRVPSWSALQPLTAAGTWIWYLVWHVDAYASDAYAITLFFVLVFWASFVAADHAQARTGTPFGWERRLTVIFNALIALIAITLVVHAESETQAGIVLMLLGAAYPLCLVNGGVVFERSYVVATTLTALVLWCIGTEWLFADYPDVGAWAALAWIAVAVGRMRDWPHLIVAGLVVLLLAVVQLLSVDGALAAVNVRDFTFVLSWRTVGYLGLMAGALLGFLALPTDHPRSNERQLFLLVAGAAFALFVTVEVNDLLRVWRLDLDPDPIEFRWFLSLLFIGTLWVSLGAAAFAAGVRQHLSALIGFGVFLLGLGATLMAFRGIAVPVIDFHHPVLNVRVLTMLAGAGILLASVYLARQHPDALRNAPALPQLLAVAAVAVVFSMLTGEARDWFERSVVAARESGPAALADLLDEQQLAISVVWLLYSVALMAAGFSRSNRGLRLIAIGLFGITILKIFLYDLSSLETGYRIVSFIGLGGILLGVSYGYQRFKHLLI
jgi:uncharacterized membrane protein